VIEVKGIIKTYGDQKNRFMVLDNVSFSIPDGASVAIVGKSGSGKSSLVHTMSGLSRPELGEVLIDGQNILDLPQKQIDRFRLKTMGFIFQSFFIQTNQTCRENVSLPMEILGVPLSDRERLVTEALAAVGLGDKIEVYARDLSGGQKQRLAIARAIVNRPRILFADEPTGNLDSLTGKAIENLLFWCNRMYKMTLIIVTHDEELAAQCDMQIMIRDGKVASITDRGRDIPVAGAAIPEAHVKHIIRIRSLGRGVAQIPVHHGAHHEN